ncbi:MAG: family 20 glycosylhydrolase [Kiritimatiellia bacterium]|nr:family 20 glycosylhydrolase [Kiritimatiellia bacterium]
MNPTILPRTIHPYPHEVLWGEDRLAIGREAQIRLSPEQAASTGPWMAELWTKFTLGQSRLRIVEEVGREWTFSLSASAVEGVGLQPEDRYALRVDALGVTASARDAISLRQAWLTLLQMLQPHERATDTELYSIPHAVIHDHPALAFRGLHVCVFPETPLEFLIKVVHLAGFLKYWHLTLEFWGMLRLDTLKELAWPMAFHKRQVQPLLDLARGYGMQVLPMFNVWGHAASCRIKWGRHVVLDQNPGLESLFEPDGWTWCLSNPQSRAILKNVVAELCDWAGPGDYFHIGCDEAYSHATCDRCRRADRIGLWVDHLNDLTVQLESLGRRPILWGDTLLERSAWPTGYQANGEAQLPTHQAIGRLSRRIVIADWHYDLMEGDVPSLAHFQEQGFDVVAAPWHELKNIRTLATAALNRSAMGMLTTTWHRLPQHLTMLAAAANAGWSESLTALDLPQGGWSRMSGTLAALVRKLAPSGGDFARAGWQSYEFSPQE